MDYLSIDLTSHMLKFVSNRLDRHLHFSVSHHFILVKTYQYQTNCFKTITILFYVLKEQCKARLLTPCLQSVVKIACKFIFINCKPRTHRLDQIYSGFHKNHNNLRIIYSGFHKNRKNLRIHERGRR